MPGREGDRNPDIGHGWVGLKIKPAYARKPGPRPASGTGWAHRRKHGAHPLLELVRSIAHGAETSIAPALPYPHPVRCGEFKAPLLDTAKPAARRRS